MKNLKFTIWLFALLMIGWSTSAQTVQIGTGTATSTNLPITASYDYTYSQQIYTQAQVNTAGEISKIRFYFVSGTAVAQSKALDWVIYMGHTDKTQFTSTTDWVPVGSMTEVFNGQVAYPASGNWMEITLTTPFVYNNTDNLVIAVDENTLGWESITWRSFTSGSNTGIYYRADGTNPNPASPPTASSRTNSLAQVQLYFTENCPSPGALTASGATQSGATLGWTNGGTETQWKVNYGAVGFDPQTEGTIVDVTTNPYTLTTLSPATVYHAYVKADCGGGDESSWVGPTTITTLCNILVAPTSEDFEGTAIPSCWSEVRTPSSSTYGWTSVAEGYENRGLKFDSYLNSSGNKSLLKSQVYDISAMSSARIQFWWKNPTGGNFKVLLSTDGGATFPNTLEDNLTGQTAWTLKTIDISSYVAGGSNVVIGFEGTSNYGSGDAYVYFDKFSISAIPSCGEPVSLSVDGITSTTAVLNWNAPTLGTPVGYDWIVVARDAGSAAIPVASGTSATTSATVTLLTPATDYDFYVKSDCGGEVSTWSIRGMFRTECEIVTEFAENFDIVTTPALPSCWLKVGTGGSVSTQTSSHLSSPNCLYLYSSGSSSIATVAMPSISNAGANTHYLKFNARANYSTGAVLEVGYLTDPTDPSSFVLLSSNELTLTYQEFEVFPGTAPGTSERLAFRASHLPAFSLLVDNVEWVEMPSCLKPTNIQFSNVLTDAVTLEWTENNTATEWTLKYGVTGFDPATEGTDVTATTNPYDLGSLTAATTYDVYVKSNCSASDESFWSNKLTFTTACNPSVGTWTENFDGVTTPNLPVCWSKIVETTSIGDVQSSTLSNSSAPNSIRLQNEGDANSNIMLVSPEIEDLNLYTVTFKAKATVDNRPIHFGYLTDPTDVSTFVLIRSIPLTTTFDDYSVALVDVGSAAHFAFKHGNGGTYRTLYVDDVALINTPACVTPAEQPTALVVNATGGNVTGSFTAAAGADAYIVVRTTVAAHDQAPVDAQVYAANDVLGNGVVVQYSNTTTFVDNGLSGSTDYFYHVYSANNQCLGGPLYQGANPLTGSVTTQVPAPVSLVANTVGATQIDLVTVANVDDNNVIIAMNSENTFGDPTGAYAVNDAITGGGTVIYNGPAGTFNHTALTQGTKYFYKAWSVNNVTIEYSTTGLTANATTYFEAPYTQDFNAETALPLGWTGWSVGSTHGAAGTNGLYANVWSSNQTPSTTSPVIVTPNSPMRVSFDYRLVDYSFSPPYSAYPLTGDDIIELQVSNDLGVTYTTIYTIDNTNHMTSTDFKKIYVAIDHAMFNGPLKFKFQATWDDGDYFVDIDNFVVEENEEYELALTIDPIVGGTATGDGDYYAGTTVTLEATAEMGYEFINWTDVNGVVSTANPFVFNMPAEDLAYTANFELIDHVLTVVVNPVAGGSVTGAVATYNYNELVELVAVPETDYEFLNWTVNGVQVATTAAYSFNMPNDDVTITANFIAEGADTYTLTLESNPVAVATLSGAGTYVEDMVVTVSLSDIVAGYEFVNWTNAGTEVSDLMSFAFDMPAENTTLVANFDMIDYNVVVNIDPVAAATVTGAGTYNLNDQVTLEVTAEVGYEFVNWTDADGVVSTDNPYVFTMGASDVELTANFTAIPQHDVTIAIDPVASGTATGAGTYYEGEEVTVTATAEVGFAFVNWTDVTGEVSTDNPYVFTLGTEDVALTANFVAIPQHDVTITIDPVASGTATGAGTYYEGEEVTVTATAAAGYEFVNWTDATGEVSTANPYVFTLGTADVALTANFVVLDFTLTLQVSPANAGSVTGAGTHAFASVVAVNTTPASPNFVFVNWTKGTDVVSTTAAFNYTMPAENVTLVANYQDVTAIADNNIEGVNVFPNPSTGIFNIVVGQEYSMQVVDVTGRLVVAKQIQSGLTALDMEQYKNGVYFIRLISESQIKTIRIVKQQ